MPGPGRPPLDDHPQTALQSERRRLIVEMVAAQPGIPVAELRRRLALGGGTLYHHLEKLARAGLVETAEVAGHTRVYPSGGRPEPELEPLESEATRRVAHIVLRSPLLSSGEIANEMGFSQRMAQKHLNALRDVGLIVMMRDGVRQVYSPTPLLKRALDDARGSRT